MAHLSPSRERGRPVEPVYAGLTTGVPSVTYNRPRVGSLLGLDQMTALQCPLCGVLPGENDHVDTGFNYSNIAGLGIKMNDIHAEPPRRVPSATSHPLKGCCVRRSPRLVLIPFSEGLSGALHM
jgi:hypothetical protein